MIVGATLLAMSIVAPKVTANSVVLTQNAYSYYVGGEFDAHTSQSFLANYKPGAIVANGFETFCIETTVEFSPGATYTYTLSDVDSQGRDLTKGAAYLYYEFGKGMLQNYNYTDTSIRNSDASELQAALWWFQGKQSYGNYPSLSGNIFYEEAITALGGVDQADAANNGRYGVDVLQMWSGATPAQNQLVLVPDTGATAGLFAMGLTVLGVARRRLQAC